MSYRLECASLVFFGDECEHKATKGVEVLYVWNGPFEELVGQRVFVVDTFDSVVYPDSVVNSCFPEIFW